MTLAPRTLWIARALALTALASPALVVATTSRADADQGTIDYVDCRWAPYKDAWGCTLPTTFTQGRFGAPPEFKADALSVELRKRTWASAKEEPGARARGRVGVFVPQPDGAWLFVPGVGWSPGEIVFLPPPAPTKTAKK